jgi:hypothetical protein
LGTGGGLAIVACTKELGNYHIVARNSQFPIWVGFSAGGKYEFVQVTNFFGDKVLLKQTF